MHSHKWGYITARKNIYIPLYAKAISKTSAFKELRNRYLSGEKIALWDFDGYNHYNKDMTFEEVVHNEKRCGHAFVIYGLLKGYIKIINDELVYDFDLKIKNATAEKEVKKTIPNELKNLYPTVFDVSGMKFISVEHFLTYSKAKMAGDKNAVNISLVINEEPFIQKLINGNILPIDIARNKNYYDEWNSIVQTIKCLNEEIKINPEEWKEKAPNLMKIAIKAKLECNPEIKNILNDYVEKLSSIELENSKFNQICNDIAKDFKSKKTRKNTL